jgi:hypothetical protein
MAAQDVIRYHIHTHSQETGFELPLLLEAYLVDMLADRLDKVDIIPEPSFGERYLQLYQSIRLGDFKDYADSALFFVSLMPEYGNRRGLNMDYYATLGISTYYALGDLSEDNRYIQLGNWFYDLQRFLYSALHSDRHRLITDRWLNNVIME